MGKPTSNWSEPTQTEPIPKYTSNPLIYARAHFYFDWFWNIAVKSSEALDLARARLAQLRLYWNEKHICHLACNSISGLNVVKEGKIPRNSVATSAATTSIQYVKCATWFRWPSQLPFAWRPTWQVWVCVILWIDWKQPVCCYVNRWPSVKHLPITLLIQNCFRFS